jgi:hypothetical protein
MILLIRFSGYAADDARAFKIARMSLLDSETPCDAFLLFLPHPSGPGSPGQYLSPGAALSGKDNPTRHTFKIETYCASCDC